MAFLHTILIEIAYLVFCLAYLVYFVFRGCPHITSANFGGFQTPPPPLVSLRQHLADPPSTIVFKEKHFLI